MPQSINTNVASLNAQRNLNRTQGTLSTALERLSTGLRINSAADDAAGLAISERFTTQIRGLNQAARNANDGISLAQTAESAIGELSNNLQRIRELAVQSANATNSASDRAALDAEAQQRIAEIDRIATQTSFNGTKVLDGTFGTAQFQVGANVGETISVNLTTGLRSGQIGQIATATGTATTTALTAGGLTIAVGQGEAVSVGASDTNSAQDKVAAINAAGVAGLTATATTEVTAAFTAVTGTSASSAYSLTINGVDIYDGFDVFTDSQDGSEVATQINLFASQTGVTAEFDSGNVILTAADGRNIVAEETLATGAAGGIDDAVASQGGAATTVGSVTLTAAENITLTGEFAELGLTNSIVKDSSTLNDIDVTTVANANDTISRIDAALTTVSNLRSDLGAIQNRFESTIVNLETVSENLSASRGRILDADFAAETAALTRAQILQQAGVAVLSQANAQPQLVLSLLQ
ncbi:MAG: flagellin [Pseudomonadota bacterium]